MRFDEFASKAGKMAADVGRRADRAPLAHLLAAKRRRSLIAGWSTATASLLFILGLALLWSGSGSESPLATAPATTTTSPTLATNQPTTTTAQPEGSVATIPHGSRDQCPVTVPGADAFTPGIETPEGPPPEYNSVWYGTPELWTRIEHEGEIWHDLPLASDGSLTQKTFWWSVEIDDMTVVPDPDIAITAELLNASESRSFIESVATNGSHAELGVFRIVGLSIPQEGCWKVTADFGDASLSYVAWVGDE